MTSRRRVDLKAILASADLRHELMVSTIQATQAREGIETSEEQAGRAYYVATEADKATFFDLGGFRGGKRSEPDRREEIFVRTLRELGERVRFDVARRDFGTIEASPLTYRRVGLVGHIFREAPSLGSEMAAVKQGFTLSEQARRVRFHWEVWPGDIGKGQRWVPFTKGDGFSRFYSDVPLVLFWNGNGRGPNGHALDNPALIWPVHAQRGFNLRFVPGGSMLGHQAAALLPRRDDDIWYLLGLASSTPAEYLLEGLTASGSWSVGLIDRLPVPQPNAAQRIRIGDLARRLHDAKAAWDTGNEISTRFERPWILRAELAELAVSARLDRLAEHEATEESRLRSLHAELDDEAYKLYGISDSTRGLIEEAMGERPPEVLWADMERRSADEKRMEHVWRLLSYAVKRVVEADEDGIVSFIGSGEKGALPDRVRSELATLFAGHDLGRVEGDITNELGRRVKGYRRVESLEEWLRDELFEYHSSLYQGRPILWHIASAQGRGDCAFGAIVHYHKLDHDRLSKLRSTWLRSAMAHLRHEADLAGREDRTEDRQAWQARLEQSEQLDRRLQWIQDGVYGHPAPGDYRIRIPWKSEDQQPKGWRPDLDDGVIVNIAPMMTAGVLRTAGTLMSRAPRASARR